MTAKTTLSDADFLRLLKDQNCARIEQITQKNNRLERIARYLDGIHSPPNSADHDND